MKKKIKKCFINELQQKQIKITKNNIEAKKMM